MMQSTIDLSKIKGLSGIENIEQWGTTFYIKYFRAPKDLKVEIKSYKKDLFTAVCNYEFWGPDQYGPYRNLNGYPSIELALISAINGFRHNDSPDYPNDLIFWRSEDEKYLDGNGMQVTYNEIQERRKDSKHQ